MSENTSVKEPCFFIYKAKPMVRKGDTIYYGDMRDQYVVMMKIKNNQKFQDLNLADQVTVQLLATDPTLPPQEMIRKKSEKKSLYGAIEIASIWLERELEKK